MVQLYIKDYCRSIIIIMYVVYSGQIFLNGLIIVSNSKVQNTVMQFQSSYVMFNGPITIITG